MLVLLAWWIGLLISYTRAFFHGDRASGVVALVMFGLLMAVSGVGIVTYRRYQVQWKRRIDE